MIKHYKGILALAMLPLLYVGCTDDYNFNEPVRSFEVSPVYTSIDEGTTLQLVARSGGAPASVTWKSDNELVLRVSNTGLVTAVAPGVTAVIATLTSDPTQTQSASITINKLSGTSIAKGAAVAVSGATGTSALFRIFVPAGTTNLLVTIRGGTGDVDLYVRRAVPPTNSGSADDCHSWNGGNNETCSIANPQSGTWYMLLDAYATYTGATLTATYTP
ncbi:MAG: pre-peptidase C-terminal domain-containing protein [Gemmatimonadaceae bacterium]|nr:pre-peptidase C-terminal domain-containing protein [Gemmatimonadaceae bacterium]